jgi:hypothetical protein
MLTWMVIQNQDILSILMALGSMQLFFCSIFQVIYISTTYMHWSVKATTILHNV